MDVGLRKYNLKTSGSYDSLEEIARTVVAKDDRFVVVLGHRAETLLRRLPDVEPAPPAPLELAPDEDAAATPAPGPGWQASWPATAGPA